MTSRERTLRAGFSLIELVIVVLIVGVISAIAAPRMTRGADNADVAALRANYALLNNAIGMYAAEHRGVYPPLARVEKALTTYSNIDGTAYEPAPDVSNGVIYGPYVIRIPAVTYGPHKGDWKIAATNGPDIGWIYRRADKHILPNFRTSSGSLPDGVVEGFGWTEDLFRDGGTTEGTIDLPLDP